MYRGIALRFGYIANENGVVMYLKHQIKIIVLSLFLVWIVEVSVYADVFALRQNEDCLFDLPQEWNEVETEVALAALDLTVSAIESNYQSISTLIVSYSLEMKTAIDKNLVSHLAGESAAFSEDPYRVINATVAIVSDNRNDKLYRDVRYVKDCFEYDGNVIELDVAPASGVKSVGTPENYTVLEEDENLLTGIKEYPGYPDVPLNQIVRVESPEYAKFAGYPDSLNPYDSYNMIFWASLDHILRTLSGKNGVERQQNLWNNVRVYEATDRDGVKWFRYQQILNNKDELNILWNENSGFLPVFKIVRTEAQTVKDVQQVRWKNVDDVYVPVETYYALYRKNGVISQFRKMIADRIEVNKPIDQEKFSLKALEPAKRQLLVDNIQKKIYRFENESPVFLANMNTEYKEKLTHMISKKRLAIMIVGFAIICAGLYMRYHSKKKKRCESVE